MPDAKASSCFPRFERLIAALEAVMGTHPATTFIDVRHPRRVAAGPVAAGVVVEDADILGTADSGECLAGSSRPLVLAAVTIGGRAAGLSIDAARRRPRAVPSARDWR